MAEEIIVDTPVTEELSHSFLEYSMSVIVSRALPDVRDGLKPVHRRIMYSLFDNGVRPGTPYKKCAKVTGDTMGRFHPHGDSAIYDALVRLAQEWSMRIPIVDGHGNFGSLDDGPAAARYCVTGDTRVRLADGSSPKIEDLVHLGPDQEADVSFEVFNRNAEAVHVSKTFNSGVWPTKQIVTELGFALRGSHNHLVLRSTPQGESSDQWVQLDQLELGDLVAIAPHAVYPTDFSESPVGTLVGAWMICGYVSSQSAGLSTTNNELFYDVVSAFDQVVGGPRTLITRQVGDKTVYEIFVDDAAATLNSPLGALLADPSKEAAIAEEIFQSPAAKRSFLRTLIRSSGPVLAVASAQLAAEIQQLFLEFGAIAPTYAYESRFCVVVPHNALAVLSTPLLGPVPATYQFVRVTEIRDEAPCEVYSLRVDTDDHSFLAGGFVNHNTECRMSLAGAAMLEDIREETVDFEPNYDGTEQQPTVLPSAFPNLIVNGTEGIAVGMATNMAPHNLREVTAALLAMLDNPDITLDELMDRLPGPDLPTGAIIYDLDGVKEAYATGRGAFKIRARARIIDVTSRKRGIEITELPYQVGPEVVIGEIKDLINKKRLEGIADVKDLSDRKSGLRLVIECKTGFNPEAVLAHLYRLTKLERSFSINAVALVNGQPETLGMLDLCRHYLAHRKDVIRRRTQFRLDKAQARLHIIDGLLVALSAIDEVVATIRSSKDADTAKKKLVKGFTLSEVQASHILEMPLRRLTSLEVSKLKEEASELRQAVKGFKEILDKPARLVQVVAAELTDAAESFGDDRRTMLLTNAPTLATTTLEEPAEPCFVGLSTLGTLTRLKSEPAKTKSTAESSYVCVVATTTRDTILAVSSNGQAHPITTTEIPWAAPKTKGAPLTDFVALDPTERIVSILARTSSSNGEWTIPALVITKRGTLKRVNPTQISTKTTTSLITLDAADEVVAACESPDEHFVCIVTSDAQLLKTPASKIRPQGRSAAGVAGIRLSSDAEVVYATSAPGDGEVLATLSDRGSIKTTLLSEYPDKGRGTAGVRCMRLLASESCLRAAWIGPTEDLLALDAKMALVDPGETLARRDASGIKTAKMITTLASRSPRV